LQIYQPIAPVYRTWVQSTVSKLPHLPLYYHYVKLICQPTGYEFLHNKKGMAGLAIPLQIQW